MDKKLEHVIHMFTVKFIQENYITLGDRDIDKSVLNSFLNHSNFPSTIVTESIFDLDYYCL